MSNLNAQQFQQVFSQMDELDRQHPNPHIKPGAPYFHGTTSVIKDGVVRSGNDADKNVSEYSMGDPGDLSEGDHAFVSEHENYAWHAADNFHPSLRRSRVYKTGPAEDMQPGPWNKEHPDYLAHHDIHRQDYADDERGQKGYEEDVALKHEEHQPEWASKTGFPVHERIDIKPGRQGTFPDIAWGRFSEQPYSQEMNHPTDAQVQYGMRAGRAGSGSRVDAVSHLHEQALQEDQFRGVHNWRKDAAPHSVLREEMGRPQKRLSTLFD